MRKALAIAAFLAMAPYAQAQDAASGTFTPNAEFRVRYQFDNNVNANKNTEPTSQNAVQQRFIFGGTFKASDKLSATFKGLQSSTWGSNTSATVADSDSNNLLIQEAYATWMMSDDFTLKVGRGALTMGDGSVISVNDWEQRPYTFDGVLGTYEMEVGRLSAWFIRFAELSGVGTPSDQDPEANSVALVYSHKALPEFLKSAEVYVMHNTKSALGATDAQAGRDEIRYGLHLAGDTAMIDYRVNFGAHTGDKTYVGASKDKHEGMMYEAELGWNMEEFMKSRVSLYYHQDSGKNSHAAPGTKDEGYDAFFYDKHSNAGLMDIVGWGNLTDMAIGYTMVPMDTTKVGLHYHMFQKTDGNAAITAGLNGDSVKGLTGTDKKNIGQEIDLVADHSYDNGLTMTGRVGMFMPGDALKDATANNKDTYTAVYLQGKMTF